MEDFVRALRRLSLRGAARVALAGGGIAIIIALIVTASDVLTPFIVGLVLAYLLMPIVNRLSRWLPRWFAILLVYAAGAAVLGMLVVFLVPPLISQGIRLVAAATQPEGLARLAEEGLRWYRANVPASLQAPIEQFLLQRALPALQDNLTTIAASIGAFVLRQLAQLFSLLSFVVSFLVVPVWLFYVLNDARRFRAVLNRQLSYRLRPDFWNSGGSLIGP
jgi:predicted PurR-regulated permease PerM